MDGIIALALAKKYADQVGQEVISAGFKVQVERDRSILNGQGQEKILYLLPKASGSTGDGYDEFVYAQNNWEWIGKTDIDLSGYALKTEVGDLSNLPTIDKSSLVAAVSETFTNVSDGKALVASAITDKGVQTSSDATFATMAQNIEDIPTGSPTVSNPALVLLDWEGTILKEYSKEDALTLTELPNPSSLSKYADVDHELLTFQGWNWALSDIKTWINNHKNHRLTVGTNYIPIDNQNHNYWNKSRLEGIANAISVQKRATNLTGYGFTNYHLLKNVSFPDRLTYSYEPFRGCENLIAVVLPQSITQLKSQFFLGCGKLKRVSLPNTVTQWNSSTFSYCPNLEKIVLPDSILTVGTNVFSGCYNLSEVCLSENLESIPTQMFLNCSGLEQIDIPESVILIDTLAFASCVSLTDVIIRGKPELTNVNAFQSNNANQLFYVPQANLSWFETATNWSTFYANNQIVTIEDNIEYLESIGIDVDEYKGV